MSVIFLLVLFLRLLRFLLAFLRPLRWQRALRLLPLQLCQLCLHLYDQHLELLFTLLAGVSVDIAGVLFAVWPFGGISSLKEMVVDFGDTARAGTALAAHVGLEIGHARLFRLGRGSFLPQL